MTPDRSLLAIYLNDHLAGSLVVSELAKRAAASNRGTRYGPFLDALAGDIEEDRRSLLEIMRSLGAGVDRLKLAGGWAAEKLGRLKLNGRLRGYSPLSRVVELEVLILGVRGKLGLWQALELLEPELPGLQKDVGLEDLIARAEGQLEELERQRLAAVREALG